MKRDDVLRLLSSHQNRLTQYDVKSLAIFGSVARDEAQPNSDVDILVEFEGPSTFDSYMDLKFFLEEILEHPVDLVTRQAIKPLMKPYIEAEAIPVARLQNSAG